MLNAIHHFATRRAKKNAPPLVDAAGAQLPTLPRSWCRIAVVVSLVPPPEGGIVSWSLTRRTLRATIHAPKSVMVSLTLAVLGGVPWIRDMVMFCVTHWK